MQTTKYQIVINELVSRTVDIDAKSAAQAIDEARRMYDSEEVILDASDFFEVTFEVSA